MTDIARHALKHWRDILPCCVLLPVVPLVVQMAVVFLFGVGE